MTTICQASARVTPNGSRSWIVEYRPHGGGRAVAKKRITLAPVSVLTPDQARETAGDILASVRLGHDVAPDRATRRSSPLVTALVERFMSEEVRPTRKPTSAALYEMYFRRYILPELGQKRAREVVLADVAKLHRKIGATKPVTANRVLELISGLYTWAARIGEVPKDLRPAHGVTRYREQGRERFLSSAELARPLISIVLECGWQASIRRPFLAGNARSDWKKAVSQMAHHRRAERARHSGLSAALC
jgi:hypothetical protein